LNKIVRKRNPDSTTSNYPAEAPLRPDASYRKACGKENCAANVIAEARNAVH
jgi:hypothetical protein